MSSKYDFSKEISNALLEYGDQIIQLAEDCIVSTGNVTIPKIMAESPDDPTTTSKDYKSGWRFKKWADSSYYTGFTIHNVTRPSITHLLENGHLTRDGKRRVDAVKHIEKTEEWAAEWFQKALKGRIERL